MPKVSEPDIAADIDAVQCSPFCCGAEEHKGISTERRSYGFGNLHLPVLVVRENPPLVPPPGGCEAQLGAVLESWRSCKGLHAVVQTGTGLSSSLGARLKVVGSSNWTRCPGRRRWRLLLKTAPSLANKLWKTSLFFCTVTKRRIIPQC